MELNIDAPVVLDILRNLYKGALRGSRVLEDLTRTHNLTREQAAEVLDFLSSKQLVINIEKNSRNGDAVYKLTRTGEAALEERLPGLYHLQPGTGRAGGAI